MNLETMNACPLCGGGNLKTLDRATNICECEPCGYIFDNPRPTLTELVSFYSQPTKYDSWLAEEEARDRLWTRRLNLLLPVIKPGSLLDVGAGIGQFLNIARSHFSSVCGTEVSRSAIEIARRRYGLDLLPGEIQAVDFEGARFDNITLFHVLEHVPNPKLLLERCVGLLSRGGVLVIAVPNDIASFRAKANKLRRALGVQEFQNIGKLGLPKLALDGSLPEIHLSHFTPGSLQGLVERCGFSILWNTLDPYYVTDESVEWKQRAFYQCCRAVNFVFKMNLYDTILVAARKG